MVTEFEILNRIPCLTYSLEFNEHKNYYMSAARYIAEEDFESVPQSALVAMMSTNTIWTLQVYPDTPVKSIVFYGATLDHVIQQVGEYFKL